jgi:RHS repeat-associated protein
LRWRQLQLAFSSSTNRIISSGFSYDSSGNLINDGSHGYGFDGDGKIESVDSTTSYTYDGEGKRVLKLVGENTRFIYGIGGALIAEYDGSSGNLKKEYVVGGGSMITIEPTAVNSNGAQYATADHLGSARVITNSSGSVVSRHDYMPFGEELGAGTGGRTTGMGFSNSGDNNRKKFTQYERDAESGLDFAEARYYANAQGRFTSPDPFSASAIIADPQTFNRYAYCRNNPVNSVDPSGMSANAPTPASIGAAEREQAEEAAHAAIEEDEARYDQYVHDAELGLLNNTSVTVMISEPTEGAGRVSQSEDNESTEEPQGTHTAGQQGAPDDQSFARQFSDDKAIAAGSGREPTGFRGPGNAFRNNQDRSQAGADEPNGMGHLYGFAVHLYNKEFVGTGRVNIYVPPGFDSYAGPSTHDNAVQFHYKELNGIKDVLLVVFHVDGFKIQRAIQNAAGNVLIGRSGGKGGDTLGYTHSCIQVFQTKGGLPSIFQGRNDIRLSMRDVFLR